MSMKRTFLKLLLIGFVFCSAPMVSAPIEADMIELSGELDDFVPDDIPQGYNVQPNSGRELSRVELALARVGFATIEYMFAAMARLKKIWHTVRTCMQ